MIAEAPATLGPRGAADPVSGLSALLAPGGTIAAACQSCYELRLHRARGYGALKAILDVLAEEESLTLTEVALRLHRTPGSTKDARRSGADAPPPPPSRSTHPTADPRRHHGPPRAPPQRRRNGEPSCGPPEHVAQPTARLRRPATAAALLSPRTHRPPGTPWPPLRSRWRERQPSHPQRGRRWWTPTGSPVAGARVSVPLPLALAALKWSHATGGRHRSSGYPLINT